ncbi:MAG: hypothetical protein V5A47_05190, partial [Bacteroidales bacterium]
KPKRKHIKFLESILFGFGLSKLGHQLISLITINLRPRRGQTAITPGETRGYKLSNLIALQLLHSNKAHTMPGAQSKIL